MVGFLHGWRMLLVGMVGGGGRRWGQKDQLSMALLFVLAPSKGLKLGSGRFRSLSVKEWAGSAHLQGPPRSCILDCSICDCWRR